MRRSVRFIIFVLFLEYAGIQADMRMIDEFETQDCNITFWVNDSGAEFVYKKIKNNDPNEQFLLVVDAVGAHIGRMCGISVNLIAFIIGENNILRGTLHTRAPGLPCSSSECLHYNLSLRQGVYKYACNETKDAYVKVGMLEEEQQGLNAVVIAAMTKHPDLCSIAAFDTFLGNADRSSPNLFFDAATNRFTGIDMAASFCHNLADIACDQIRRLHSQLSEAERCALRQYQSTLMKLVRIFRPHTLCMLLEAYAFDAGFYEPLQREKVAHRIARHKKIICQNYASCLDLIDLIDEVCN